MSCAGQNSDRELWDDDEFNNRDSDEEAFPSKFIDPEAIGCELAEELAGLDEEALTDVYVHMVRNRNVFFIPFEGNKCIECSGGNPHHQYHDECIGCKKDPISDMLIWNTNLKSSENRAFLLFYYIKYWQTTINMIMY